MRTVTDRAERLVPYRRRSYVFTQMQGTHAFLPQFMISIHKVDDAADMQAYIKRIAGISTALDQLLDERPAECACCTCYEDLHVGLLSRFLPS